MGTDTSTTKEYPTLSSTAPPPAPPGFNSNSSGFHNGDHKVLYDRHSKADFRDAFADPAPGEFFPEDIPGIPKYRPSTAGGDFADRYVLSKD